MPLFSLSSNTSYNANSTLERRWYAHQPPSASHKNGPAQNREAMLHCESLTGDCLSVNQTRNYYNPLKPEIIISNIIKTLQESLQKLEKRNYGNYKIPVSCVLDMVMWNENTIVCLLEFDNLNSKQRLISEAIISTYNMWLATSGPINSRINASNLLADNPLSAYSNKFQYHAEICSKNCVEATHEP